MEKIKLGDLCKPSGRQIKEDKDTLIDYIDISAVDNETKKVTGYHTITFGESPSRARKAVKRGNILVSTVRPNLNAVALLEEDTPNVSVASTGFCVLESKDDVDPRFIFNFCKSKPFIDDMVSQATGASYPAVSDKIVRSALIPKYSYQEQQHISNVLDKLVGIIDSRRIELQKLDNLIKARFVEMFDNKYPTVILGDVIKTTSGGTPSKAHPEYYNGGNIPWLSSGEVNAGVITSVKNCITEEGMRHSSAKMVPKDSVVVAMYGATAGVTGILRIDTTTNQAVCSLLPTERFIPEFLYHAVASKKEWMISQCQGGGQPNISQGIIKSMELIDAPIDDQKCFTQFVKQVDKSKVAVQKALDETQTLFDCLMQEYFG